MIDRAIAHGEMVDNLTLGTNTAGANAWIHALHIRARTIQRTVGIDNAFRTATDQWIAEIATSADTGQDSVMFTTLRIRSAFDRIARGGNIAWWCLRCQWHWAVLEWIALHSMRTRANRIVIDDGAQRILAARSDAWIDTSLSQTGSAKFTIWIP